MTHTQQVDAILQIVCPEIHRNIAAINIVDGELLISWVEHNKNKKTREIIGKIWDLLGHSPDDVAYEYIS